MHAVIPLPSMTVHHEYQISNFKVMKNSPTEIVVSDQPDISISCSKSEICGCIRNTGYISGSARWLVNHPQETVLPKINTTDRFDRFSRSPSFRACFLSPGFFRIHIINCMHPSKKIKFRCQMSRIFNIVVWIIYVCA